MGVDWTFSLFGRTFPVTAWTLFGFSGNLLFTTRMLVQWIASERQGRSVVPVSFWWLSWIATVIFIVYALGRRDVPFLLGFVVTLVPYTRNLVLHYRPRTNPGRVGGVVVAAVVLAAVPVFLFYRHQPIMDAWTWFGLLGNAVFGSRFFIQWVHSEARGKSVLPLSFWYVSLVGGMMLLCYSFGRRDVAFILAFLFTVVPYVRNILLLYRHHRANGTL